MQLRINYACMFSRFPLFGTLKTVAHQVSLFLGFSRQEYWSGLPCPPPGDLPNPGIKPAPPATPALQAVSLPLSHQGSPKRGLYCFSFSRRLAGYFLYCPLWAHPMAAVSWQEVRLEHELVLLTCFVLDPGHWLKRLSS